MLSWAIEPEPLPCDMVSWLIAAVCPMVSCFMPESFDIVEFPTVLWDIVSCDMVDELWASAGTANDAAIRAAAAKVGTCLNMDGSFKGCRRASSRCGVLSCIRRRAPSSYSAGKKNLTGSWSWARMREAQRGCSRIRAGEDVPLVAASRSIS
jgi:hypothetical protein